MTKYGAISARSIRFALVVRVLRSGSSPSGTTACSAMLRMRVMAQENRDMRMSEAEKKAAALPPKLTVPMILFFLPVLFVVILGPAAIKVMAIQ